LTLDIALGTSVVTAAVVVRAGGTLAAGDRAGEQFYPQEHATTTKTPVTNRSIKERMM